MRHTLIFIVGLVLSLSIPIHGRVGALFKDLINHLNPDRQQGKATHVIIEVVPELMKYDTDTFTVVAGDKIILDLDNRDGMQHNLLILKPGSLEKVGAAADAMLSDPNASEKHYVPEMPEVLFATEMLDPEEIFTLTFTAPSQPGDYPFVCTFPGHWRMMNGIMQVKPKG
ncbi:MAG: plastocyanin/azurin family copper-binding protein [Cyclobacteriaceae bacterium]